MKTVSKYIVTSSLIAILTITLFGAYSIKQYQEYEMLEERERLETCIRTFWELLGGKMADFKIIGNQLVVGANPINNRFEVPDKIQEIYGGVATIFMDDVRVSTNVLTAGGKRALGTRLIGPAYDAVFKQGRPYRGMAEILGEPYLTAYDPILNRQGEIVGVLFVGIKEAEFLTRLKVLKLHLVLTLSGMVVIFTLFMIVLGRAAKRVEDANENHVRFQQTLMDTIPTPIFFKDSACRYLGCNKAFEEYVGFSQDKLLGKTPHELWPDELADIYRQQDQALLENPGTQVYETSARYADGSMRDVVFNKATFNRNDGSVMGLVGVILDITERKTSEEATKSAYRQLLDIVEFLPDATFVVDQQKRVIAWNRAIEQMTGVSKQEILGKGNYAYAIPFYNDNRPLLIDLLDQEQERFRHNYIQIKQEGHTLYTEVFVPSFRNGASRTFWATATPLFDKEGNKVGAIESIRDITEYKQTEDEKKRMEAQLNQARLMESVIVRLGHDLKTPLTPLFALLPLLQDRVVEPDLKRMVEMCLKSATTIKNLAEKSRLLSSLSSTANQFEFEAVSIVSVVERAFGDCNELISRKQISCRTCIKPELVVRAIPTQLFELFVNLISNAVYFSSDYGVVEIVAERFADSITVSVRDEGIGLSSDHLDHVFDEFFKADESRHDLDSAGLGLSISKRIVRNHNGRIWAESPGLGKGTTIKFTIQENIENFVM